MKLQSPLKNKDGHKHDQGTQGALFASPWKSNLIIISALILVVLGYFYWQTKIVEKTFISHAKEHAHMLSRVVKLNAENAILSQVIIEEVVITFLKSSAEFIDYLDSIQPFSEQELTAFAIESSLFGIRIVLGSNAYVEGPGGWFPGKQRCKKTAENSSLCYIKEMNLYCLSIERAELPGYIIVGLADPKIDELKEQLGLQRLFETISGFGGINYVKMEHGVSKNRNNETSKTREEKAPEIRLIDKNGTNGVAEVRFPLGSNTLVTGLATERFLYREKQLWHEFFLFSIIIAMAGAFFTWMLHKKETAWFNQIRKYEQRLAREKEDTSLGRASASITHEVRNPLNAISMGLQRLNMEACELEEEHRDIILNLLQAVKRTDRIIAELKKYSGKIVPANENIMLEPLLKHIIALYHDQCRKTLIEVDFKSNFHKEIIGDRDLLEQSFENLIKNGIEAQPHGGYIKIRIMPYRGDAQGNAQGNARIFFENKGFKFAPHEAEKILEPYFTTKTRGTGLGLAMVSKIIHAHGGNIKIKVPESDLLRVELMLP